MSSERNVTVIHTSGDDLNVVTYADSTVIMGGEHGYLLIPAEHRTAVARALDPSAAAFENAVLAAAILIRCLDDPELAGDESLSEVLSEARHYARQRQVWNDDWDWDQVQNILEGSPVSYEAAARHGAPEPEERG